MILLDTHALLWLQADHARSRPLAPHAGRLCISPATLLEIQFLVEAGRIRPRRGARPHGLVHDPRWLVDAPPALAWFEAAADVAFTRDPFDRLLVAHARLRGFKLATGDGDILANLPDRAVLEL